MSGRLEARYRRLLAWYPREHRAQYETEMLNVLLTEARPGQTRPDPGTAMDLVWGAVKVWLRRFAAAQRSPQWRDAAAVAAVLGLLVMMIRVARGVLVLLSFTIWHSALLPDLVRGGMFGPYSLFLYLKWGIVLAFGLAGLRRVAAILAWVVVCHDIVTVGLMYPGSPTGFVQNLWWLVLGIVIAAAMTASPGVRHGFRRLGTGLTVLGLVGSALLLWYETPDLVEVLPLMPSWLWWLPTVGALVLTALLACRALVRRLGPPVLLRALALLGAPIAVWAVVQFGFAGYFFSSSHFASPIFLEPVQWLVLFGTPVVSLVVCVIVATKLSRALYLMRQDREATLDRIRKADRPAADDPTG